MTTSKKRICVFLSFVFIVVGVSAQETQHVDNSDPVIPRMDCVIEPSEIVDVGSAVPGKVESINAYRSDFVKKDAVIAQLESSVEQASLELAKTRAGLGTTIKLRKEVAAFDSLTRKRNQELMRTSAISVHDMDKLKTEARIAQLQVTQEKDNKRLAELEYLRTLAVLKLRTIRSPVEGVVIERFKSVGEYVEDEPLVRVAQLDPLNIEVIIPVDYMGSIVLGMQAEVKPDVLGAATYVATVERIDKVADAASGTYGVRLSLPNTDYKISSGLRCELDFLPLNTAKSEQNDEKMGAVVAEQQPLDSQKNAELQPQLVSVETIDDAAESKLISVSPEVVSQCFTLGPILDQDVAKTFSKKFEAEVDDQILRNENIDLENGYIVFSTPELDKQATLELIARFEKAGVADYSVLARGSNKGRVSLGVYRGYQSALTRKERLTEKDFQTEIIPRYKVSQQYWLDLLVKGESAALSEFQKLAQRIAPSVSYEPIGCSAQLAVR